MSPSHLYKQHAAVHNRRRVRSWWSRRSERTRIILSISSLLLGLVILAIPFAPWIIYFTFKPDPVFPYETQLAGTVYLPDIASVAPKAQASQPSTAPPQTQPTNTRVKKQSSPKPKPQGNRLVIPKIRVDVEIVEGEDERALSRGIWHLPYTSTPDKGGNTVLTGHRFRYLSGPKTLYLLDQMKEGDVIIVYWKGKEYDYQVKRRKVVNPDAVSILDDTEKPQLTVFTCTPIFSTKKRLVLFAEPMKG